MFNPQEELAKGRRERAAVGNRLSFVDQCGLFAARGIAPHSVLAKAFGVTTATVSLIANCEKLKGRYKPLVAHLQTIGPAEFDRRYYTEEIHLRITRLKHDVAKTGDDRSLKGPNHLADKYAHANFGAFNIPNYKGEQSTWRVEWIGGDPPGWRFGEEGDTIFWQGKEAVGGEGPFRTSADAFDGAHLAMGQDSPRPKAGRPKTSS